MSLAEESPALNPSTDPFVDALADALTESCVLDGGIAEEGDVEGLDSDGDGVSSWMEVVLELERE